MPEKECHIAVNPDSPLRIPRSESGFARNDRIECGIRFRVDGSRRLPYLAGQSQMVLPCVRSFLGHVGLRRVIRVIDPSLGEPSANEPTTQVVGILRCSRRYYRWGLLCFTHT